MDAVPVLLFPGVGSAVAELTVAAFVALPASGALKVRVTGALPPAPSVPTVQLIVPGPVGEQVAPADARQEGCVAGACEVARGHRSPLLALQVAAVERRNLRERRKAERRRRGVDTIVVDGERLQQLRTERRGRVCR